MRSLTAILEFALESLQRKPSLGALQGLGCCCRRSHSQEAWTPPFRSLQGICGPWADEAHWQPPCCLPWCLLAAWLLLAFNPELEEVLSNLRSVI